MSRVSIQIVTFNSEKYIKDCLESVLQQSYPIHQVIVVDNASTDGTLEISKEYRHEVTFIENRENRGFAFAHNQAFRLSQGDYILVLNPDVILHPDYVRQIVGYMKDHPHVGSACGKLLLKSSTGVIDSTGLIIKKTRRAFDRGAFQSADMYTKPAEVFGVSGAAAIYRREMIEEISYNGMFFDEDFFAYKEDVDVAWRSQLFGWKAAYVPDAIAYHERGWKEGSRSKQPIKIRRHSYINRYRMMLKNDSLRYCLRHLPHLLLYEIASFGYVILKEPELLSSWVSFFRDFPKLLRSRKWIMSKRKVPFFHVYRFFR
jgi:GT2 family glycosyltransferase